MLKVQSNKLLQPFVKWAGGKRQLLPDIRIYIPTKFNTYFEPFLGGAAVLFNLQPAKAVVNDMNSELINVYRVIKFNYLELIEELKTFENSEEFFYSVREWDRKEDYKNFSSIKKAARIIYLNKTCYNGLFRVNSQGQFNAPFGNYKNPNIINEFTVKAVHNYLNENEIAFYDGDFEDVLQLAAKNDFVYMDPPYDPISDVSSFTGYTFNGFGPIEQYRLQKACDSLNDKGVKFLLSNSSTDLIKDLYKKYKIEIVQANRSINSIADRRGKIDELLIRNY
ncbi:MAG: DNA adenine methylase [bacterium]